MNDVGLNNFAKRLTRFRRGCLVEEEAVGVFREKENAKAKKTEESNGWNLSEVFAGAVQR